MVRGGGAFYFSRHVELDIPKIISWRYIISKGRNRWSTLAWQGPRITIPHFGVKDWYFDNPKRVFEIERQGFRAMALGRIGGEAWPAPP